VDVFNLSQYIEFDLIIPSLLEYCSQVSDTLSLAEDTLERDDRAKDKLSWGDGW